MSELDKLELYLIENDIRHERKDTSWRHQIVVFDEKRRIMWDAVCNEGSYGYEDGLLEIMGDIVTEKEKKSDDVVGWLTAKDVIERIENK